MQFKKIPHFLKGGFRPKIHFVLRFSSPTSSRRCWIQISKTKNFDAFSPAFPRRMFSSLFLVGYRKSIEFAAPACMCAKNAKKIVYNIFCALRLMPFRNKWFFSFFSRLLFLLLLGPLASTHSFFVFYTSCAMCVSTASRASKHSLRWWSRQ